MLENKLLTIEEVIEILNVKKSWLRKQMHLKKIPFKKLSGLVRFDKNELDKWLLENSI